MASLTERTTKTFRFWCQKALPLVYDDSLSYYEVLCKVVNYMNEMVKDDQQFVDEIARMEEALAELKEFMDSFDTTFAENIIREYLATMIFVEIPDGHFVYYIPESWDDIHFETTGYDVTIEGYEYGHLVLNY